MTNIKVCTQCNEERPATLDYFYKGGGGLHLKCKSCMSKIAKNNRNLKKYLLDNSNNLQLCRICKIKKPITLNFFSKKGDKLKLDCIDCLSVKKICTKCKKEKPTTIEYFHKRLKGLAVWCKVCAIENKKIYRSNNKEKINKKDRQYYKNNKEEIKSRRNKNYYANNKDKYSKSRARRLKKDPIFKLRVTVAQHMSLALSTPYYSKQGEKFLKYLSYSKKDFKFHIESQFKDWMNWNNYGIYNSKVWDDNDNSTWTWNLDHIIPQSNLIYDSMDHPNFLKCWALENLRPYSAKQNVLDGANRTGMKKEFKDDS